jgi:dTDP-4-dehydrorhamnose reductase
MKALILGHNGMLGNMVLNYLESKGVICSITNYRFPSTDFENFIKNYQGDFIINCIGSIQQKNNNFDVNFKLPADIENISNCKIIYPGSDCEDDNSNYGKSKRKATNFIKSNCKNTKIIKTSIIGPEISSEFGLMEWFLSQKEVKGFSEFYWNGNTTLTWAKYCYKIMKNWNEYGVETILHSECISKYSLLKSINEIYNKNINIIKIEKPAGNRCLSGGISTPDIKDQLKELKEWSN